MYSLYCIAEVDEASSSTSISTSVQIVGHIYFPIVPTGAQPHVTRDSMGYSKPFWQITSPRYIGLHLQQA